jgi:DNA-binding winged helix-turn-helix (wHTH) protein
LEWRIIVEDEPADTWSTCSNCECGLDARPIQRINGRSVAACPLDANSDAVLDEDDLKSFRIDVPRLVAEIASASGFASDPSEIMNGVWHLGAILPGHTVFVVPSVASAQKSDLVPVLRAAVGEARITLLAPDLSGTQRRRLKDAGMELLRLCDAVGANADAPFALSIPARASARHIAPRLIVVCSQQSVTLDGTEIALPPRPFTVLLTLAEAASQGLPLVQRGDLQKRLYGNRAVDKRLVADAVRDLREKLASRGRRAKDKETLIETRSQVGYALAVPGEAIQIIP